MSGVSAPLDAVLESLKTPIFYSFRVKDAIADGAGQAMVGKINNHDVLVFSGLAANVVYFEHVVKPKYANGDIAIDVYWSGPAVGPDVDSFIALESLNLDSQDIDVDSFAASRALTHSTASAPDVIMRTTIVLTRAQADNISANVPYRLRISRNGNLDTDNNDWHVHHVVVRDAS